MRLSIAVGALPFYPTSTTFRIAKQAGVDGIELLPTHRMLRRGADHYARMAESRQLTIYSVHEPLRWSKRHDIARHLDDATETIDFAARIPGCEVVVLHFPTARDGSSAELGNWLRSIDTARRRSQNPNLRVTLENSADNRDKAPHQLLDDIHILRRMVGEWDLYLTFDVAHAASRGLDLIETVTAVSPRLANIHMSDARQRHFRGGLLNGLFRDHRLPGSGHLPISEFVYTLCQLGYDGLLTLEPSPVSLQAWLPFQPQRRLKRVVETISEDAAFGTVIAETTNSPRQRKTR